MSENHNGTHHGKINIIGLFFCIVISLIIFRLYTLQIKDNVNFQVLANNEQGFIQGIQTARGLILSKDGVELAINVPSYDVYVYTPNIQDLNSFENKDLSTLGFSKSTFEDETNNGIKYFEVAKDVSPDQKDEISKKLTSTNLQALQFVLSEKRNYPNGSLLSQVIGFVNLSSGKGEYGIEGQFDADLQGISGSISGNKDQFGNPIANSQFSFTPPTLGENITLTVDAHLQKVVEDDLKTWVDKVEADSGTVIIMDPKTGAIMAMANYPTFAPNAYYKGYILDCNNELMKDTDSCKATPTPTDPSQSPTPIPLDPSLVTQSFDNSAISMLYEPGSVIKAITAAAAVQDSKITPDTKFDDNTGIYEANGEKVYNFSKQPDGVMTMQDILKKSSNVGASMVAKLIGKDEMYKYYEDFGIGSLTGITLDTEETASVPKPSTWEDIDLATASFGQYVGATPLQVIGIYQTLANNGTRMKPYIVQSVDKNGQVIYTKPQSLGQIVSPQTAQTVTKMLVYATTGEPYYGLGTRIPQYMPIIASKTGTAQVPLKDKAGYSNTLINTTYVGYAPANNPKFVMLTMLKYPRIGQYSSQTAVPLWGDIAKDLFTYMKIPPQ